MPTVGSGDYRQPMSATPTYDNPQVDFTYDMKKSYERTPGGGHSSSVTCVVTVKISVGQTCIKRDFKVNSATSWSYSRSSAVKQLRDWAMSVRLGIDQKRVNVRCVKFYGTEPNVLAEIAFDSELNNLIPFSIYLTNADDIAETEERAIKEAKALFGFLADYGQGEAA